ncbi:MAG: hypothetical protein COA84_03090 [Robiginitomaculum sp.]|nr:MAG: hypothetical protein COA84_03090 [Robiginitomaculum sp.]
MAEHSNQVPVLRCVVSAFLFLRRNLAYVYGIGALYVVANIASTWLSLYRPQAPMMQGLGAILSIILIPLVVMLFAAFLRRGLGMGDQRGSGLQFGTDELRLFLTMFAVGGVSVFIIFLGVLAGMFMVSAVVASVVDPAIIEAEPASAFAHAGMAGIMAAIVAALGVGALGLYTLARFSPAYPAAIAERRVVIFEAATWSKGQGWRMALAILLTGLPFYLILAPGMIQYAQYILAHLPSGGTGAVVVPEGFDLKPFFWFFALSALIWPASKGAISGLYVTFYRGLRANEGKPS